MNDLSPGTPAATDLKLARLDGGPEIFYTLQGEGIRAGRPSVFVRVSLCNLHCVWCDTDYTWNWEGTRFTHERDAEPGYQKFRREDQILVLSIPETVSHVIRFACQHVVLTGGEPLLQQSGLTALMQALRQQSPEYTFEVETNGTLCPDAAFDALVSHYNVSPKLANSGNTQQQRDRAEAMAWFAESPKAWFKFVVAAITDIDEIETLAAQYAIPRQRILLMPEGRSTEALETHRNLVVRQCLEHGYSFSDRLHLKLFGAKRGT